MANPEFGAIKLGKDEIALSPFGLPIIYFEHVPSFSHLNGIIGIPLVTGAVVPGADNTVIAVASVVAHLKCNIPAARALRDVIDSALLLAQPVEKPEGPAN